METITALTLRHVVEDESNDGNRTGMCSQSPRLASVLLPPLYPHRSIRRGLSPGPIKDPRQHQLPTPHPPQRSLVPSQEKAALASEILPQSICLMHAWAGTLAWQVPLPGLLPGESTSPSLRPFSLSRVSTAERAKCLSMLLSNPQPWRESGDCSRGSHPPSPPSTHQS